MALVIGGKFLVASGAPLAAVPAPRNKHISKSLYEFPDALTLGAPRWRQNELNAFIISIERRLVVIGVKACKK
jgi:hypothetical protein